MNQSVLDAKRGLLKEHGQPVVACVLLSCWNGGYGVRK